MKSMFIFDVIDVGGRNNPGADLVATEPSYSTQQTLLVRNNRIPQQQSIHL
jgi:hypothetical protein